MSEQENSLRELSSLQKFFAVVKDYKELATAIAILAGGISWFLAYFATKEEFHKLSETTVSETRKLHCLMEKRYDRLEGKELAKIYRDDLMAILEDLKQQKPTGTQFSEYDTKKIIQLEQQRDELKDKIRAADNQESEAERSIRLRECEK
jgi:hypothetical protein